MGISLTLSWHLANCECPLEGLIENVTDTTNSIGSFFESEQNSFINSPFTFFEGVMLANSPQLLLSVCYLTYNNMFTRLQMAREWSLFSEGYQGLRVTDPKVGGESEEQVDEDINSSLGRSVLNVSAPTALQIQRASYNDQHIPPLVAVEYYLPLYIDRR